MVEHELLWETEDRVCIVRNMEPSDENYLGYDVLIRDYERNWACVGEFHVPEDALTFAERVDLIVGYLTPERKL